MKLQNIVLLGFVSSAVEYLNEQFNNDEIGQYLKSLNSTELEKLRNELNVRLESSIGVMNNTVETLMKTGSAAFLDFINDEENSSMINELLAEKQQEQAETEEFMTIIAKAADEANAFEESVGELVEEVKPEVDDSEELDALFSEIVGNESGGQQSASDDEMVEELLKELKEQLDEKGEELAEEESDPTPVLFADALSALMSQNDSIEKYLEELAALEGFVNENDEEAEETDDAKESLEDVFMEVEGAFDDLFSDDKAIEESLNEDIVSFIEPEEKADEEPETVIETEAEEFTEEEPAAEEADVLEETQETIEEPAKETEPETTEESSLEETEEEPVVEETVAEEVQEEPEVKEEAVEEPVSEETAQQEYVSDLVEELKRNLAAEEEAKKKVPTVEDIYVSISQLYPHLSRSFIRSVYDLKEPIASTYPLNKKIIVLHRLIFTNIENLRSFVESVLGNNYTVNVDEKKMLVDTFKEHVNSDGRILANIFEISNLAKGYGGEYEGYRVIVKEDE